MLPVTRFAALPAFAAPADKSVTFPRGFRAAGVAAGIKRSNRLDVGLLASDHPCVSAAFFTRNAAVAAPVVVTRDSCACERLRAVIVNSGNANACTGAAGMRDALAMREQTATALGVAPEEVAVCSTGVIGLPLPMGEVESGIATAAAKLSAAGGPRFAAAIRTTDRLAKHGALALDLPQGEVSLGFAAKGAGMIAPAVVAAPGAGAAGHATMLCFVTCDAVVRQQDWQELVADAVAGSLNRITVDGQESTNDTVLAFANGASGVRFDRRGRGALGEALRAALLALAVSIVADGEGSTKVVRLEVSGARDPLEAERVARAVGDSPLVKTAFFGEDPNWGRVVQAAGQVVGYASDEPEFAPDVAYGPIALLEGGAPVELADAEQERLLHVMEEHEIDLRFDLHRGDAGAVVYFSDLTHQYVTLNAEYTT